MPERPTKYIAFFQQHRKVSLMAGGVLLATVVLIIGSITLWSRFRTQQATKAIASVKQQVTLAQTLKGQDNKKAMELIDEASKSIASIQKKYPKASIDPQLLATIDEQKKDLFAVVAVENPETLFNLALIKDSFNGSKIVVSDEGMLAIDAATPTILKLNIPSKTGVIASGGSKLPNFLTATLLGEQPIVLLQDGVYSINGETGDPSVLLKKDENWKNVIDLATFANNVYVLDQGAGQIWKYTGDNGSFSSIKNVVNETQGLLSNPQAFQVDGLFWVLQDGGIAQIQNGKVMPFSVENLDVSLGSQLRIASSSDSKNVYIFDKQNGRVVVATKEGQYVKQYKSVALASVVDIAIADNETYLYLLTKDKVLQIPLSL